MLRESLPDQLRAKREDDIFSDKLPDQGHTRLTRPVIEIFHHHVNVIKLTDEVFKIRRRKLLHNTTLDQLNKHLVLIHILDLTGTRQLVCLLFGLARLLLFLLALALLFLATAELKLEVLEFHLDHLIYILLEVLLHNGHDLLTSHLAIVLLLLVVAFIAICPFVRIVIIKLIKLLDNFGWANSEELFAAIIIVATSASFLAFATLSLAFIFSTTFLSLLAIAIFFSLGFLFFFRRERGFEVVLLVELFQIFRNFAEVGTIPLNPVTTLLQHAVLDIATLNVLDFGSQILLFLLECLPMITLDLLAVVLSLIGCFDWVILFLFLCLRLALHAKENHLLLTHLLDGFAGKDSTNEALNDFRCLFFVFLFGRSEHFTVMHALANIISLIDASNLLKGIHVTATTLATSLILLNQADGRSDFQIEGERIIGNFLNWLSRLEAFLQSFVDLGLLFVHGKDFLFRSVIVILLFLAFFTTLLSTFLAFLLFATFTLDFLLEDDIDWDLIIFFEVAWNRDLNDGWIVLEIEEKTVQMHVDRTLAEVVEHEVLLDFANSANRALKYLLDKNSLLRVHNLVIALFELAIDLDVLDVEDGVV